MVQGSAKSARWIWRICWAIFILAMLAVSVAIFSLLPGKSRTENVSDYDLLNAAENPRFFDYVENPRSIWPGETRVAVNRLSGGYHDDWLLYYELNYKSHVYDIQFYFSNADIYEQLAFDDIARITFSYLPAEILLKCFNFAESYVLRKTSAQADTAITYYLEFQMKEEAEGTEFSSSVVRSNVTVAFSENPDRGMIARIYQSKRKYDLVLNQMVKEPWDFDYRQYLQ